MAGMSYKKDDFGYLLAIQMHFVGNYNSPVLKKESISEEGMTKIMLKPG